MVDGEGRLGIGGFVRRSLAGVGPRRGQVVALLGALVLGIAFAVGEPLIWKVNIDQAIAAALYLTGGGAPRPPGFALTIALSIFGFVLLALVQWIGNLAANAQATRLGTRLANELRTRLFDHMQSLSTAFYTRARVGDLVARVTSDVDAVEAAWTRALPSAASHVMVLLVGIGLIALLDWRFGLVDAAVGVALVALWARLAPAADRAGHQRAREAAELAALVQENVQAQPVVKAFGLQQAVVARFDAQLARVTGRDLSIGLLGGASGTFTTIAIGLFFLASMLLSIGLFAAGALPRGAGSTFIAIGLFIRPMVAALQGLAQEMAPLRQAAAAIARVDDMLAEQPGVADAEGAAELPIPRREIALRDVGFSYTGERVTLSRLSATIEAGKTVAVVGPSGSGKTTLVNLLTRLYDPSGGAILIDGQDLRAVTQASLHRHVAVVFQDTFLFDTTIRENIRLGRPDASDAAIEEAARQAELHDFVRTLPRGYETTVGELGVRLSAGQRQRLALARALVRQPAVLILDEATAALDSATEAAILATLKWVAIGRTVVMVSHRLASVAHADQILVLDGGRLVGQGTHAELLEAGGTYRQLWEKQEALTLDEAADRASVDVSLLRTIPVLERLDDDLLRRAARRFVTETAAEDRVVVHQNDPGDKFYVVVRGALAVTSQSVDGAETQLRVLRDGDYFGEVALLRNVPRTATVRTLVPTTLLSLQRAQFDELLEEAPDLRRSLDRHYVDLAPA